MAWLRDLLSPSNLWAVFKFFFPGAAGVVMGWLTWVGTLPISVPILVGLVAAACILIIFDALQGWFDKRNKYFQRIAELEAQLEPKLQVVPTYRTRDQNGKIGSHQRKQFRLEKLPCA